MASEDVARVHREAIIVEGHRDMFEMNYLAAKGQQFPVLNVTLPRLKRANISTTFYAISGDSLTHANGTYRFLHAALQNIDALRTEMAASQGQMKLILHRDIICANSSQAKGPCGACERDVTGPAGEGDAAAQHRHCGGWQCVLADIHGRLQYSLRQGAVRRAGPASSPRRR